MQKKLLSICVAAAFGAALNGWRNRAGFAPGAVSVELEKDAWSKLPKDVQALYVEKDGKYRLDGVEVEDTKGLKSALNKERERATEQERLRKELEKRFEGIDAEEVRRLLDKLGSDEERQLMKDGKIDEVVSRRMEKANKAHQKAVEAAEAKVTSAGQRADKFAQRVLDNHVRAAATKVGMHPDAVEDALFRARTIFSVDDEGNAVQLDGEKKVVLGKDGKNPFTPVEWLDTMKDSAKHWFPAGNAGGGANGNKGGGGGKTMKRSAWEAQSPEGRAASVKEGVQIID